MRKRKVRLLTDLYAVTEKIMEPQITPVLRGSCRIQGPVDESDHDTDKNMGSHRGEKRYVTHSVNENICNRAESGTCNVCAAPCSSCMHLNRALSREDINSEDEFSDETSIGITASVCSFNVADVMPRVKNKALPDRQCVGGETSNLRSVSSSHDSFSENAESKVTLRTADASDASDTSEDRCPSMRQRRVSNHVVSEQRAFSNRFEEQRGLECHGDNISCVSGANDAKLPVAVPNVGVGRKNVSSSSASVSSLNQERFEKADPGCPAEIKCEVEESSNKIRRPNMSNKEASIVGCLTASVQQEAPASKDLYAGDDSLVEAQIPELSKCSNAKMESTSPKFSTSYTPTEQREGTIPKSQFNKDSHTGNSSSGGSVKMCPSEETRIYNDSKASPSESVKGVDLKEEVKKPIALSKAPAVQELPLQPQSKHVGESDNSEDIVVDVKVCDICGDAGREELLAICSRCGDGAEHTYCMRIMVDKVPEGDWLCEECKFKEDTESQKKSELETSKVSSVDEKNLNSGSATDSKPFTKSDIKVSGFESKVSPRVGSNVQISSKRPLENVEVSASKRQALETSSGSPKPISPSKKASLARDTSFKSSDKGKVKSLGLLSSSSRENLHSPTSSLNASGVQPRQFSRGTLLKSNSFTASNLKPKVKLVPEDFRHKSRLTRDIAVGERKKERNVKTVGKSHSFKSSTLSKLKIDTPNLFGNKDEQVSKLSKERGFFERKNSFKTGHFMTTSPKAGSCLATPKAEKIVSRGESILSGQATNNRNHKGGQVDGKSSKPVQILSNRGLHSPKSLAGYGDLKRQSSSLSRGIVSPSSNGILKSPGRKLSQISPKEELSTSNSRTADKTRANPDAVLQSQQPVTHARQTIAAGDSIARCQICKEIGHTSQFCSIVCPRVSVVEVSASTSSKELTHKTGEPKASVGTASFGLEMQKISKIPDQSNGLSPMSYNDTSSEVASLNQPSTTSFLRSLTSMEVVHDGQDSVTSSFVVPQIDYIWQGGFDVQRGENLDLVDGIQAHLSTCASPKVPNMVNKFPQKILLEEVPRLTTWPSQFQNHATEANIALYFFAKDTVSYITNYKSLLENMIENDLALKANFDGIELLIFPSNQLPEDMQRWNTLFYLWGVFKGRRAYCCETISGSQEKLGGSNLETEQLDRESAFPSFTNNRELPIPSTTTNAELPSIPTNVKDISGLSACSGPLNSQEEAMSSCSMDLPKKSMPSRMLIDLNSYEEEASLDHEGVDMNPINPVGGEPGTNLAGILESGKLVHEEMNLNDNPMEENKYLEKRGVEFDSCSRVTRMINGGPINGNALQVNEDNLICDQTSLPSASSDRLEMSIDPFKVLPLGLSRPSLLSASIGERVEEKVQNRSSGDIKDEEVVARIALAGDILKRDDILEWRSSGKRLHSDTLTSSSQTMPWNVGKVDLLPVDEGREQKKTKIIGGSSSFTGESSTSERFRITEQNLARGSAGLVSEELRTDESFFFPGGLDHSKNWTTGGDLKPLNIISCDDDQPKSNVPNLDLALGADKKSSRQGLLPFLVGPEKKKEQSKLPSDVKSDNKDDEALASLSLSLAFPLSDGERTIKPSVSEAEKLLSENHPKVDTSLFLFGGYSGT